MDMPKKLRVVAPSTMEAFACDGDRRMLYGMEVNIREAVRRWNAFEALVELVEEAYREGFCDAEKEHDTRYVSLDKDLALQWKSSEARSALEAAKEAE